LDLCVQHYMILRVILCTTFLSRNVDVSVSANSLLLLLLLLLLTMTDLSVS